MVEITTRIENRFFILKLSGIFNYPSSPVLKAALENGACSFCDHVLLDFKNVQEMDRACQEIILSYFTRLQGLQMHLIIFNVGPKVNASFHGAGIDGLLTIAPNLTQAKALAETAFQ